MNQSKDTFLKHAFRLLPRSTMLYKLCNRYADDFKGQNNGNIAANGELRWLKQVLPHCETCFDVGANVGDWAHLALSIKPLIRLHCFEPSPATFRKLLSRNLPENVICNNFGLSSAPESRQLWVFEDGAGINSLYRRSGLGSIGLGAQERTEEVRLDALDAYCARLDISTIDLLKVDVEGHELAVFNGAQSLLSARRIKRIQFEYGGCNIDSRVLLKDLFECLAPHGYTFAKLFPRGAVTVPRYDQSLENFQYQNWVATAPGVTP
jgi:FkbM family methyltransferase